VKVSHAPLVVIVDP